MLKKVSIVCLITFCLLAWCVPGWSGDLTASLQEGSVDLKSAGPLAFGPEGILFVGDPRAAAIFAIATGDTSGNPDGVELNVAALNEKVAAALGTTARDVLINDLAVNPASGNAYLSVSRGRGPTAAAVLLRVDSTGKISEVSLEKARYAKAALPDAPPDQVVGEGRRRSSPRQESITDLAYSQGQVLVAGLSNEEFASTLRSIPFPFESVAQGTSVEIFHGSHGRFETHAPVRTFATYNIENQPHLLAAYTCTPLVKFPLSDLKAGAKVQGITVAELGNRNRPLDMFVYQKGGKDFILMANSSRGMMKISTDGLDRQEGITQRISDKAGQTYETIDALSGVVELDRLNAKNALVIVRADDGTMNLRTVALP